MVAIVTAANVGAANGVAPLDANSAVPVANGGLGVTSLAQGAVWYSTSIQSGTLPVAHGGTGTTSSTGTGALVLATGASLSAPTIVGGLINGAVLGSVMPVTVHASSITTSSLTISGRTMGAATGSGDVVLSNSPVLVTPNLGTPSAAVLTNATGLPLAGGTVGILPTSRGGTGAASINGLVKGNGAGAMTAAIAGVDYLMPGNVGAPGGIATLDSGGKLSANQIPDSLLGALNYQGTWDANTNTPTLTSGVGTKGRYYKVAVAGHTNLNGNNDWWVGDLVIFNGTTWDQVDGSPDAVSSVNGLTGAVMVTPTTIGAAKAGVNTDITEITGLASPLTVSQGGTGVTTSTGVGAVVLSTSATLVNPNLGTPDAAVLTNATGLPLTTGVTGVLDVANGGTGAATVQEARNTLAGATTTGFVLRGDGTNVVMAPLQANDVPVLNQNTTGSAATVTAADQPSIKSVGVLTGLAIAGSLALQGTGAPVLLAGSAGTAGQILTSSGPGATPTWTTVSGAGTVTSVQASGGTTGLTFSGGPITNAGTLTLGGTLSVANGGTGVTTSTGTGAVVLSNSPTLVTPNLGKPSAVDLGNATNVPLGEAVGVLSVAHGGTGGGDASTARTALGAAKSGSNSDITALTGLVTPLSPGQGGTGTTANTGTGSNVLSAAPVLTGTTSVESLSVGGILNLSTTTPLTINNAPGASGYVLTSHGAGAAPSWEPVAGTGTVTSVQANGGSTGLTFSGGPITGAGTLTLGGMLGAPSGGTGQSTYIIGDLLYAVANNALGRLASIATGNVLLSGGVASAPTYGKVGLTTHVAGTLPVANGGTGVTTSTGSGANVLATAPTLANPVITGGSVDNAAIGSSGAAAGAFTTLSAGTSLSLAGAAVPLSLNGSTGTAGQVLTSSGGVSTPIWTTAGTVTSVAVSGGATGLVFSGGPITSSGTITMSGALMVTSGGTGVTTSTGTGSNVLSKDAALTGTTTMTGVSISGTTTLVGTSSPLVLNSSAGTAGQVLTSAGNGATPTWTTLTGAGTVTSVQASGGSTGLTFSGGPITNAGTLTLGGILSVANGGTGTTSSTGSGANVLAGSPTFTGTVGIANATVSGSLSLTGSLPISVSGSSGTVGQVLTSQGASAAPVWTTVAASGGGTVTSVGLSGGTTGLTVSGGPITGAGVMTLGGTLGVANGGTGATSSTGTGSNVLNDSPSMVGTVTLETAKVTSALRLDGTTNQLFLNNSAGTAGQVLTSAGAGATPTWTTLVAGGTVTSVGISGGSTGLTASGGPITGAGTITLGGVLSTANGGTGITSMAVGDLFVGGAATFQRVADVATGNVLLSGGVGAAPSYGKVGLTTHVTGTLPVTSGGTGATTSTGSGAVVLATSPTFVTPNLGTPSAAVLTNATGLPLATGVTGTLPVTSGGTGVTTSTGTGSNVLSASPAFTGTVTMVNATLAGPLTLSGITSPLVANSSPGTVGQVLTSGGAGATPTWTTLTANGTVTSVQASGGTTGLTFSGGPVTSSGTLTLGGTLNVANGGTGTTTSTGTGSVVLSNNATLTGTTAVQGLNATGSVNFSAPVLTGGSVGNAGEVLTSQGSDNAPTWTPVVTSFSGGSTGLLPATGTAGSVLLSGTLNIANGGTGTTTSTGTGSVVLDTGPTVSGIRVGYATQGAGTNAQGQGVIAANRDLISVTTATSNPSGVTLPSGQAAGRTITVVNDASNPVTLYPPVGGTIDGQSVNDPITLPIGSKATLTNTSATRWLSSRVDVATKLTVPVSQGGTGATETTGTGSNVLSDSPTLTGTVTVGSALQLNGMLMIPGVSGAAGTAGTAGQVLQSNGPGAAPSWGTPSSGEPAITKALGYLTWDGSSWVFKDDTYAKASDIANAGNWNTAYSWGNHATAGYATTTAMTTALAGKADSVHTHSISDVTNLQSTLDGKQAKSTNLDGWSAKVVPSGPIADTSSAQSFSAKTLVAPVINNYVRFNSEFNAGNSGTAVTLNFANGQKQRLTLTGSATITLSFPGVGNYQVILVQDATGSRTVTWPGTAAYVGSASAPAINTNASGETIVSIYWNGSKAYIAAAKVGA